MTVTYEDTAEAQAATAVAEMLHAKADPNAPDFVPNAVREFIGTLMYAPAHYLDTLTMMLAITHCVDAFTAVPLGLATAKEPGTGKTVMTTHLPLMLAFKGWKVGRNTTEPALMNKFLSTGGRPTLLADDIGKIFGDSGRNGQGSRIYQLLIDCYLSIATVTVSVNRVATDLPAFTMAFLNGLHEAVPPDLETRTIHFRLQPKPPKIKLRDALDPSVQAEGKVLNEALHAWAGKHKKSMTNFMRGDVDRIHPMLTDRRRQVWGPVFAAAAQAGGTWPERIREAFLAMALDASERPVLLPAQQCLLDTAQVLMEAGVDRIFTADLVTALRDLPEGKYYTDVSDRYLVQRLLPDALGPSQAMRGYTLANEPVTGKARMAAPILEAAADLRDKLYPPPGSSGPDETELELALTAAE